MPALIKLNPGDREAMVSHLLSLEPADRAERFMATVNQDYLRKYVGGIAFEGDIVIGALQAGQLVGLTHAAVYADRGERVCEAGISVLAASRRQGVGRRMMLAAIATARQADVHRIIVLFNPVNRAMAALARSLCGQIERGGSADACAVLQIGGGVGAA